MLCPRKCNCTPLWSDSSSGKLNLKIKWFGLFLFVDLIFNKLYACCRKPLNANNWLSASAGAAAEVRGAPGAAAAARRSSRMSREAAKGGSRPPPPQPRTADRSYLSLHQLRHWLAVRRGGEAMILSYITIITLESLTHIKSIYKDLLAVLTISK